MRIETAYICDYCGAIVLRVKEMRAHEAGCKFNPESRSCDSCEHFRFNGGNPSANFINRILRGFDDRFCDHPEKDYSAHLVSLDGRVAWIRRTEQSGCGGWMWRVPLLDRVVAQDVDW